MGRIKDAALVYMVRKAEDPEFNPLDIDPLCILVGSLHVSDSLDPKFIGLIVSKLTSAIDHGGNLSL